MDVSVVVSVAWSAMGSGGVDLLSGSGTNERMFFEWYKATAQWYANASGTYLTAFALDRLQLSPLLDGLRQIDLAQWYFHLADLVVLGEAIEVENREDQRLVHGIGIWKALCETMRVHCGS